MRARRCNVVLEGPELPPVPEGQSRTALPRRLLTIALYDSSVVSRSCYNGTGATSPHAPRPGDWPLRAALTNCRSSGRALIRLLAGVRQPAVDRLTAVQSEIISFLLRTDFFTRSFFHGGLGCVPGVARGPGRSCLTVACPRRGISHLVQGDGGIGQRGGPC